MYVYTSGSTVCVSACSSECVTCSVYADFCTQCRQLPPPSTNTFFLLPQFGRCFNNFCPQLYYINYTLNQCISCSTLTNKHCTNCTANTNSIVCLSCDNGYYSMTDSNNLLQCVNTIPDGYVNINNQLIACIGDCLTCISNPTTCLSCKLLNYINNQCITQCPSSHYSKQSTIMFNSITTNTLVCQRCQPQCNTCYNETFCTSCLTGGYFLIESDGLCVDAVLCPLYTYPNTTTYKCEQCIAPCLRCNNQNECLQCVTGFYLLNTECVSQCPVRKFAQNVTIATNNQIKSVCSPCITPCDTCINQTLCLSCLYSSQLLYYAIDNSCLVQCPMGYKADTNNINCILCPQNCSSCNTQSCTECKIINTQQYLLFTNISNNITTCRQSCPQSYYPDTTTSTIPTCQPCPAQCKSCQNSTYCTTCSQSYYFYSGNNSCLANCPPQAPVEKAIIGNNSNNGNNQSLLSLGQYQCISCSKQYCINCTKLDYCTKCINSTTLIQSQAIILSNGQCLTTCPANYTKQYNNQTLQWSCQQIIIIPPIDNNTTNNNTNNTTITYQQQQSSSKGIIIPIILPFIASYVSAAIFIIIGSVFLTIKIFSRKQRLFLPFVSGLLGFVETLTIGYVMFYHLMYNLQDIIQRFIIKPQTYLLYSAALFMILLSLVNFIIFCKIFCNDSTFHHWNSHNSLCSKLWFVVIYFLSLINFKLQNLFWSKFSFFPVLSTVDKLKPFTVISGFSLISILGFVVSLILLSNQQSQLQTVYYDGIAVLLFSNLINLFSLKRPQDLFIFQADILIEKGSQQQQWMIQNSNMKINLHKRISQTDTFFINSIKPTLSYQQHNIQWQLSKIKNRNKVIRINSQQTLNNSQRSILNTSGCMSFRQQQQQNGSISSDICIVDDDDNEKQVIEYVDTNGVHNDIKNNNKQNNQTPSINNINIRQHHSLTGIYEQSRSEIQTNQQSLSNKNQQLQQQLNKAISDIDEGSEVAQLGSAGESDSQQQVQYQQQSVIINDNIDNNKVNKPHIQSIKITTKLSQYLNQEQNQHQKQQQFISNKNNQQSISFTQSDFMRNFMDISQLEDNKQSLLKIDISNCALCEDSINMKGYQRGSRDIEIIDLDSNDDYMQRKNVNNKTQLLVNQWKQQLKQQNLKNKLRQVKKQQQQKQPPITIISINPKNKQQHSQSIINNSQYQKSYQQSYQQQLNSFNQSSYQQSNNMQRSISILREINQLQQQNMTLNQININYQKQQQQFQQKGEVDRQLHNDDLLLNHIMPFLHLSNSHVVISHQSITHDLDQPIYNANNNINTYTHRKEQQKQKYKNQTQIISPTLLIQQEDISNNYSNTFSHLKLSKNIKIKLSPNKKQQLEQDRNDSFNQQHYLKQSFMSINQIQSQSSYHQKINKQQHPSQIVIKKSNHNNRSNLSSMKNNSSININKNNKKNTSQQQQLTDMIIDDQKNSYQELQIGCIVQKQQQQKEKEKYALQQYQQQHILQLQRQLQFQDQRQTQLSKSILRRERQHQLKHQNNTDTNTNINKNLLNKDKSSSSQNNHKPINIIKEDILLMDDKQFRSLKSKLKHIQKEEQKHQIILRKIQQGRKILTKQQQINNNNLVNFNNSKSKQKSRSKSKDNKNNIRKSIEKDNFIEQSNKQKSQFSQQKFANKLLPKKSTKRKNHLHLQSKQHVQKIYKNSSFSGVINNNYSKSLQKKKSLSKDNKNL